MEQHSNAGFRRTIRFTRSKGSKGFFSWPSITFILKSEDGKEIGQLSLKGQKASYTSAAEPQNEFRVKKNFWGTHWLYDGDDGREFGRFKFGFSFKPSFTLSDGERYYLKAKHPWPFRRKKLGVPVTSATFTRENNPVMRLESFAERPAFTNEATAPMKGTISTNLDSNRTVAALLLFYQTFIDARSKSAH